MIKSGRDGGYPFLGIAQAYNVDYGHVLHYASVRRRMLSDTRARANNVWEYEAIEKIEADLRPVAQAIFEQVAYEERKINLARTTGKSMVS